MTMGLFDQIKKRLSQPAADARRGSFTPRIAGDTSKYIEKNVVKTMPAAPYLFDKAQRALIDARESLRDDRERGHKLVERFSGAENIPAYWHLAYSAGFPLGELAAVIDEYLDQLEYFDTVFTKIWTSVEHNRIVDVGSKYPAPLLDLAWLVGLGASKQQIARFLPFCGEPGQDALFDRLVQALGFDRVVGNSLRFPNDYRDTLAVFDAPAEKRAAMIQKILPKWFRTRFPDMPMTKPDGLEYTGYWALDLALVVMLLGIDDASFRDNPLYPRELVDHYRSLRRTGV